MIYALALLCDWVGWKRCSSVLFSRTPRSDYAAWWGAVRLLQDHREDDVLKLLESVHQEHPEWKRAKRLLATIYLRRDPEKAVRLYTPPMEIWEEVFLGDFLMFFLNRREEGLIWWQRAYEHVDWRTAREQDNPARLLLKRIYRFTGDKVLLERFAELDTDNFRQQEIIDYAELLAGRGERDKARETLDRGFYIYRNDARLSACWARLGLGDMPSYRGKKCVESPVRYNISTGLLTEVSDLNGIVDQVHAQYPDGTIAVASSVVTMCEGTLLWTGTFKPSRLARFLGPYTGHGSGKPVHWYTYPVEAAWKVQAYMEIAGTFPVLLGALATVFGKILHRKGWFYDIVGPVAKAVDSDKVMPYDGCLVPGPLDVNASVFSLTRNGARVGIVDVNDVYGAEVVAASDDVDRDWLKRSLDDNPAGNDDSMTPIVVVMQQEQSAKDCN